VGVKQDVEGIVARFDVRPGPVSVRPFGAGHINRSWSVTVRGPDGDARYLLQQLNEAVFGDPVRVMENVVRVTEHLGSSLRREGLADADRRALRLVPTREGQPYHRDATTGVWRLYPFIADTAVSEHVATFEEAREVGRAFGTFQRLLADYRGPRLHETIPRFHDTAGRVDALERAVRADRAGRARAAASEIERLLAGRGRAEVLPPLLASGKLPERIAHNDAKSGNVLLDAATGAAVCVVDLDTVMPGPLLFDFGDMVRSCTSPTAEDEEDLDRVGLRLPLFEGLAAGYQEAAASILTDAERGLLAFAGTLITYEQAVRFLTDHLDGDRYYRTTRPDHNLARCRTQLRLLETLVAAEDELAAIVARTGGPQGGRTAGRERRGCT